MKKSSQAMYVFIFLILICSISGCSMIGQATGGLFSGVGSIIGGTLKLVGKALDFASKLPRPPAGIF